MKELYIKTTADVRGGCFSKMFSKFSLVIYVTTRKEHLWTLTEFIWNPPGTCRVPAHKKSSSQGVWVGSGQTPSEKPCLRLGFEVSQNGQHCGKTVVFYKCVWGLSGGDSVSFMRHFFSLLANTCSGPGIFLWTWIPSLPLYMTSPLGKL